jgi:NitT/TauT family transport system ATP-binding protein
VPPSIAAESVRKIYDGGLEAIHDVSFSVDAGQFVSVLGPSGCGKSTLLMMVAGLIDTTSGRIAVDGVSVAGPRREVGVMFQSPVLLPWRSALENVLVPIEMLGLSRAQYSARARELLSMAKLDDFATKLPRELSGGMQQRVAMCRALIHDPHILLMDEPFSALDALTRDQLGLELLRIWERHQKTVLFVTHSIREAVFLSDRVLVMTQRPATITQDVDVTLPRPRQLDMQETEEFNRYVRLLRKSIEASHGV